MNESQPAIPDPGKSVHRSRFDWLIRIAIFVFSFVVATSVLIFERGPLMRDDEFVIGEPAPRTFFSPIAITYVDEKNTHLLRNQKAQSIPPVLTMHNKVNDAMRKKIEHFFSLFHEAKKQGIDNPKLRRKLPFSVSEASFQSLLGMTSLDEIRKYEELLMEQNLRRGIIEDDKKSEILGSGARTVSLVDVETKTEKIIPFEEILTLSGVQEESDRILKEAVPKDERFRELVSEIFTAVIAPNLEVDEGETRIRRLKAQESVPAVLEEIKKEELVVQRGMLISADEKQRLDIIQKELQKLRVLNKLWAVSLMIFITYFLGFIYLFHFDKKTFWSLRMNLLLHTIILLSLILCKIVAVWPGSSFYLMPIALAPLLVTLLSHWSLGLLSGIFMAVMVAPLSGFSADVIVAAILCSTSGIFSALRVRKRVQFLKVGLAIGGVYAAVLFAFQIFQDVSLRDAFHLSLQGLASGFLITTPIAFLLLPLFESFFNLTTDITLLELSDLNHPILRRMIIEAPGTYHHSLVVSTLAESACQAVGANALLARVGAYFHDIGKIARAEYFTENQSAYGENKHKKLTPTMSCLLIMNHVRDGIELGKRNNLKERILQFIPEHQGTGVIYYFYKKALDHAQPGERVNADDFRYPGPKPQSKETAVVMLSDSTEAASRSLKDPSPEGIRQLVRKIINDKFIDGQLDECNLTLKDLHKIQESFIHNLMAIFHTRVRYPVNPECPEHPDLFKEHQFSKFRLDAER